MFRYRLRTLLILLAILPPLLCWGWRKYEDYRVRQYWIEILGEYPQIQPLDGLAGIETVPLTNSE
jgi:hypothetical protein